MYESQDNNGELWITHKWHLGYQEGQTMPMKAQEKKKGADKDMGRKNIWINHGENLTISIKCKDINGIEVQRILKQDEFRLKPKHSIIHALRPREN